MSGTIIGIANAFGASISPGAAQGSAPGPPPSQDPMNFYVTPYNSAGTSTPSGQYKLGLYSTGIYNFTVDWGDGNTDVITSYNQPEVTHDYGTVLPTDDFEITITPNSPIRQQAVNSWYFGNRNEGDGVKVRSIDQFGATLFYADQDIFYGCEVLSTFASTISNVPTILNKVIGDGFFFNCDELAPAFYTAYWVGPFTGTAESFNEGKSVAGLPVGNSRGKFELDFTPTNMFRAFKNQAIFNQNDVGLYWDVSSCNNFTECFSSCLRYNQPFPNWTFLTGTPVFAADMFKNAVDFNQNITGWNTSAFQDMGGMFARTLPVGSGGVTDSVFNQAIGVWNTDNVRDASAMFFNAVNFNQDLSNWFSTGSLQNIGPSSGGIVSMFSGATSFNSSVANWDLTNPLLTSVSYVFNGATSFDQPLNSWDVSGVSFFVGTFNGATAFNQNLALWDVSSGLFFSEMFKGATSFVGTSLTSWNVSSATDMQDMFNGATSFTNSLVFWNPSSVTNMSGMFNGATLANPNVSGWNISSLANASDMFTNSGLSSFNYQALLVAWAAQAPNIQNGVTLSSINQYANFGAPADAKAKLVNDYGWTITDLVNPNLPPPALTFTIDTTATEVGSTANNQYRLPLISSGTYDFYVQWGDGDAEQITSWNQAEATHTYAAAGTYTVKMFAVAATTTPIIDHISWASQDGTTLSAANDRLKVQDISEWAAAILYLNEYVFTNCENLNITTTSSPTFGSKVLRTSAFENCDNLSGDLSGWGTVASPLTGLAGNFYKNSTSNPNFNFVLQHNVGSLIQPFQNCAAFNNPLNNWDVSSVIGFTAAFSGASAFNQDISGWDTGNSSAFNAMFSNALAFNQNISSWNVASVTTFSQMFQGATLFNQPVGAWTTTSLTNLFSTFKNAAAFDQDLANWDVSGVTTAVDMLTGSNISAANWDALLIGWAAQGTGAGSLQANVTLSNINQLHGSVDSAATAAYNKLTSAPYNWTIVDLGGAPVGNLLLDTSYGSGAESAYSVRKLRTAYTGPAMKVQDTVGGATQDIYFDANDNLDEAAIISYGGSNDVFVETWYDQSVNGNDATQVSSANRPKIYDGTTGALVKDNGKVALDFDGSNDSLTNTAFTTNSNETFAIVANYNNASSSGTLFDSAQTDEHTAFLVQSQFRAKFGSNTDMKYGDGATGQKLHWIYKDNTTSSSSYGAIDGGAIDALNSGTNNANGITLGNNRLSSVALNGQMQELILFGENKTSNRTSIESNIGDYFTQNTPLLDTYTGAAAAYSLRLLDSTYTGFAIKVQDNVGGATQDIGFDVFGELDTVSLAAYAGSNDVFVETWYDQSGNGNNASQASSANRPKIYDATTGVVTENGKPAVDFDGSNDFLSHSITGVVSGSFTYVDVFKSSDTAAVLHGSTSSTTKWVMISQTNTQTILSDGFVTAYDDYFKNGLATLSSGATRTDLQNAFFDGQQNLAFYFGTTNGTATSQMYIGRYIQAGFYFSGVVQESVLYTSDESSNRTGIESNINTFYDVYTAPVAPLLLNEYPGAAAAYSLRKINSSYQGSAVLVQTALNTKGPVYIGFDSNNDLDTTSLAAYGGSEDVVVAGWLDQSGNGNDATQGTSASRPKIYDGTTGVVTENGKPAVDFDGTDDNFTTGVDIRCFTSFSIATSDNTVAGAIFGSETAIQEFLQTRATTIRLRNSNTIDVSATVTNQNLVYALNDTTSGIAVNGGTPVTSSTLQTDDFNNFAIGQRTNTDFFEGRIQEITVYASDQSTNRTNIEGNIGGYYDIPLPGLLDENPGAAAAYSLRRLSSTYTGSAIQVQRADNVGGTTDIGFDSYGDLDTAALATAAQGNDMVVATWYDQSGNSNDATQTTATRRRKIYDSSTGVISYNGKPAAYSNSSGVGAYVHDIPAGTTWTSFATYKTDSVAGYGMHSRAPFLPWWYLGQSGSTNTGVVNGFTSVSLYKNNTQLTISTRGALASDVGTDHQIMTAFGDLTEDGTNQWHVFSGYGGDQSFNIRGYAQEVVIYNSDQSANRTNIEENVGGYYDIPLPGLLDENPGAAAAYSLRRLSSTYTGSAIQVQRADNVGGTTDIGFDSYGELDTTALTTAAQGNDMVVATWYDQSGNGNDISQATSTRRPKIYDGTTGAVLENGKPTVDFDGINDKFDITNTGLDIGNLSSFMVGKTDTTGVNQVMLSLSGGTSPVDKRWYMGFVTGGNINFGYGASSTAFSTTANTNQNLFAMIAGSTQGNASAFLNSTSLGTATLTTGLSSDQQASLASFNNAFYTNGNIQELIYYSADKSTNRTDIEENIGGYYDIPLAGLLDENPGAEAGYSLRRLSSTYTGSAIQVQRADNVGGTTDIGFDSYGELDTTALTTAAAGNDMVVATWYDQSGNSNNATQATSANRPKIYDGTTGVVLENGKPAVDFDGSNDSLKYTGNFFGGSAASAFSVSSFDNATRAAREIIYGLQDTTGARYDFLLTRQASNAGAGTTQNGIDFYIEGDFEQGLHTITDANQHLLSAVYSNTVKRDVFDNGVLAHSYSDYNLGTLTDGTDFVIGEDINGGNGIDGNIQEIVIYNSDQSSNRLSIEDNVGEYYGIEIAGLLDQYSGAAAGYSLRKLSNSYTGFAIKVQDNVGGATQDIGFNADGELDTVALIAYAGSNDVFVETWYDQSGNGNDASQATSASRPKIYDGTTGVVLENGKPAVDFDGSNDFVHSAQITLINQPLTYSAVSKLDTAAGTRFLYDSYTGLLSRSYISSGVWKVSSDTELFGITANTNQNLFFNIHNATNSSQHVNGNLEASGDVGTDGTDGFTIGKYPQGSFYLDGKVQELICWSSNESANRTGIENNINFFYDIY